MPKFSANISLLFSDVDEMARYSRARQAGFSAVEIQFPYSQPKQRTADELSAQGLEMVLHNLPCGDWEAGDRGIAIFPERKGEFQDGVALAMEYAQALGCKRLNCLAGRNAADTDRAFDALVENLRFAATELHKVGIGLLIEAINTRDVPGFFVSTTKEALTAIEAVGHENLTIQYDIYHMQVMAEDLIETMRANLPRIGHMQLADNPGRHEPGTGEINFPKLFEAIDGMGYEGWIGCEYNPLGSTEEGLGWMHPFRKH